MKIHNVHFYRKTLTLDYFLPFAGYEYMYSGNDTIVVRIQRSCRVEINPSMPLFTVSFSSEPLISLQVITRNAVPISESPYCHVNSQKYHNSINRLRPSFLDWNDSRIRRPLESCETYTGLAL
jgi:hypothetical protein